MKIRFAVAALLAAAVAMLLPPGAAFANQGSWPDISVRFINFSSGQCVQPISLAVGAPVVQEPCGSGTAQRWRAVGVNAQGYVFLINIATALCLDLAVSSPEEIGNGTPTVDSPCDSTRLTQRWNKVPGGKSGYSQIFNQAAQTSCLDVTGRSSANGAIIQIWSCKLQETAQEFKVTTS